MFLNKRIIVRTCSISATYLTCCHVIVSESESKVNTCVLSVKGQRIDIKGKQGLLFGIRVSELKSNASRNSRIYDEPSRSSSQRSCCSFWQVGQNLGANYYFYSN
jgi:hypothetical protein